MIKRIVAIAIALIFAVVATIAFMQPRKASAAINTFCVVYQNPTYPCIIGASTPTPVPSATPTPAMYANVTPPFSAPSAYPDAGFQPYASTSVWNQPSPAPAASVDPNSSTWNSFYQSKGYPYFTQLQFGYDNQVNQYQHPIYFGRSTDPTWTLSCTASYGDCSNSFHAPSYIIQSGGTDHHLGVIDNTTNLETDIYGVTGINYSTHVISALDADHQNYLTGDGLYGEQTHGGAREWAGVIRAQELIQGHIDHALFIVAPCTSTTEIFPSVTGTGTDQQCAGNAGPPYGAWMRLNMTAAQIAATGAPSWAQTIMTAFALHGGFIMDANNMVQLSVQTESDPMYTAAGYTNTDCSTLPSGAPCTPLTAYFYKNFPSTWTGHNFNLNVGQYVSSSAWQFIDSPPGT